MSNKQLIIVSLETFNNPFSFTLKPQAVILFSLSTQAFTFTWHIQIHKHLIAFLKLWLAVMKSFQTRFNPISALMDAHVNTSKMDV